LHVAGNQQLENHFAPLQKTQTGRILHYQVDLPAFAQAIRPNTRLFLLCHPHNPVGRIWNQSELHGMAEYCIQNNVIICSDEIHSELLLDGHTHTPLAALAPEIADQTITLIAPSKTRSLRQAKHSIYPAWIADLPSFKTRPYASATSKQWQVWYRMWWGWA